ncbi:glucose 1-dehydrogenase [Salinimonas sp. HHU 13199]|uniref:Glucose 1-dehydrogenase n=1 Tax=Salinimonas profundi TaxID=2729140 RepID=A0ABR8LD61_9ALTE|nr:glucose 1-dehydrogenase [Salinimonas profundi]MBD3584252.1 glucose 1-dehydrogenase [Salinimonas profundi]
MDPLLNFQGQVAIITGAADGFGRLLADALAYRGCKLVLADINEELLAAAVKDLREAGGDVVCMTADVSDEASHKALVELAVESYGKLDIAVNNAGIAHIPGALHTLDEKTIDEQFNVNLKGVFLGMKHQIPAMLSNGKGHVLNVSSMAGLGGAPKAAPYSAVKHGVVGLTKTAAVEYGRKNIQVNAICPFFSPTSLLDKGGFTSEESRAQLVMGSPMKRMADPQEVVSAMVLMLSPANSFMSGQAVAIDGAMSAW